MQRCRRHRRTAQTSPIGHLRDLRRSTRWRRFAGGTTLIVALVSIAVSFWGSSEAAFSRSTTNSGNTFAASGTFPTYSQAVAASSPYQYYRQDEAPSASATSSAAADASAVVPFAATYNGPTNGPSTWWRFDEGAGSTAADSAGGGVQGTVGSGATWTTGHTSNGLLFDGTSNGFVGGTASAVNSAGSFTVAAWVNPNANGTNKAAISLPGTNDSAFFLGLTGTNSKWRVVMTDSDVASPPTSAISYSTAVAALNTWTHLAATYNATTDTLTLYVNGNPDSSTTFGSAWSATQGLQAGRRWHAGGWTDPWTGQLDDVLAYRRALSASEVGALAAAQPTARLSAGQPGALQGPQSGEPSSTAVAFAGSVGVYQGTAGAPSATATEECWFKASGSSGGALLGFSDSSTSASGTTNDRVVYLDSGGQLTWGVLVGATRKTVRSTQAYDDGAWHHVVGSVGSAGLKLYVDGTLVASDASVTAGNTTPSGYARWGGQSLLGWPNRPSSDYFIGTLDELSHYQRQLSDLEVYQHFHANH
jgi:hypothetical protein